MYGAHLGQTPTDPWSDLLKGVLALPALQPLESDIVKAVNPYLPTVAQGVVAGWWAQNRTTILVTGAAVVGGYFLLKAMR